MYTVRFKFFHRGDELKISTIQTPTGGSIKFHPIAVSLATTVNFSDSSIFDSDSIIPAFWQITVDFSDSHNVSDLERTTGVVPILVPRLDNRYYRGVCVLYIIVVRTTTKRHRAFYANVTISIDPLESTMNNERVSLF
jgi:hypothetical protein